MLTSAAAGLACGAILGRRCKVFVLVPVHLLAIAVFVGVAVFGSLTPGWTLLACVLWSVGCNVAYIAAAIMTSAEAPSGARQPVPPPLRRARP